MSINSEKAEEYSVFRGELSGVDTRPAVPMRGNSDKPRRENAVAGIALKSIERVQPLALAEQSQDIEADQQYRWLLDHSPVAMCVHADGRYVYVNQTLVRKMGAQSAGQLLGRKITDFIHPDSRAAVRAQIAARQHDGDTSPPLEMVIVTLDGVTREVEALAIQTQWEGRPAHKVVFRDVSAQKATEANLRFQAGAGRARQRRVHLHDHVRICDQLESGRRGDLSAVSGGRVGPADRRGCRRRPRSGRDCRRRGSRAHHPPGRRRFGAGGAGLGVPDGRRIRRVVREPDGAAAHRAAVPNRGRVPAGRRRRHQRQMARWSRSTPRHYVFSASP